MKKLAKLSLEDAKKTFNLSQWPITEEALKKQYRMLSLQHHPDRGGSHERMQEINNAAETLFDELPKENKTEEKTFSKLHGDVEKAVKEYKNVGHEHNETTAEIMSMEEKYQKWLEKGHIERALLDANGVAKIQIDLKGGGTANVKVWKDKQSRKTAYMAEVESLSPDVKDEVKEKLQIGKPLSDKFAEDLYYRAEKYRNIQKHIKDKKKSVARQKANESTFEKTEEGVGGSAYYLNDPSESTASELLNHMLKTNVLKVLSRGANKGKVTVDPSAVQDLSKSKDLNARFIAGVVMLMRGYVDKRVTSNWVATGDANSAAEAIASKMITGDEKGIRNYEKEHKLDAMPRYEENLKDHEGKTAEQVGQEAHDEELAKNSHSSMAEYYKESAKKDFEDSKEHREKGVYKFNGQGNYSDKFKEHHGEHLKNKDDIKKKTNEILNKMSHYAKMIAQVMIQKGLMHAASFTELADRLDRIVGS